MKDSILNYLDNKELGILGLKIFYTDWRRRTPPTTLLHPGVLLFYVYTKTKKQDVTPALYYLFSCDNPYPVNKNGNTERTAFLYFSVDSGVKNFLSC